MSHWNGKVGKGQEGKGLQWGLFLSGRAIRKKGNKIIKVGARWGPGVKVEGDR